MQDGERAYLLSGRDPPDRNLFFLDALDQLAISRRHWISPQPEFTDMKVLDDVKEPIHVIVVRVCQDHGVQFSNPSRKQVRGYDVLADRKCAFVAQVQET